MQGIVHDLDDVPYPLPSDHFTEVVCMDIMEHIADVGRFLHEIHRGREAGAIVRIRNPQLSSHDAYRVPTHRNVLGYPALDRYTLGFPDGTVRTRVRFSSRDGREGQVMSGVWVGRRREWDRQRR